MQALYGCKQDKHPYNCTCNYDYDYNYNYPLYKYLLKYSFKAYILESFILAIK